MHASTPTYGLRETLLEPRTLAPPPTRHALFVFVIALAAILHLGTAGWSEIHNGVEGEYASTARALEQTGMWNPPGPPLHFWLTIASFKIFGASAMAAHLPVALALVSAIAFTFLIGERLASYWRGFIAGLIHLGCVGSFIWARIATPEPLFAACLGATLFCAVSGYERRNSRAVWFASAWVCMALGCLAKGVAGLLHPALILLLVAFFCREARIRFRSLLHWRNVLLFLALLLPWLVATQFQVLPLQLRSGAGVPLWRFLAGHFLWWFPALLLVLPGVVFEWRKVFRPHDRDLVDVLPLCWMAVGFLPLLVLAGRQDFDSMNMWSAFALFAATAWDRLSRPLRLAGLALVIAAGAVLITMGALNLAALPPLPSAWLGARSVIVLGGIAILFFALLAAYFSWKDRETL
ncbi:MAG: glycosyltransferase family 39 protein, partial [Chthoniobacterales bacterium]